MIIFGSGTFLWLVAIFGFLIFSGIATLVSSIGYYIYVISFFIFVALVAPAIVVISAKSEKLGAKFFSVINSVISAIVIIVSPQFIFAMIRFGNFFDSEHARAASVLFMALVLAVICVINLISNISESNIICMLLTCLTIFLTVFGANTVYDKAAARAYEENLILLSSGREFYVESDTKIYQRVSTTEFRFPYTHVSSEWIPISFEKIEGGTVVCVSDRSLEWKDENYAFVINESGQSGYVKTDDLTDYTDASYDQRLILNHTYINGAGESFCFFEDLTCIYSCDNMLADGVYEYESVYTYGGKTFSTDRYKITLDNYSEPIYVEYEEDGRWTFSSPNDNWELSEFYLQ